MTLVFFSFLSAFLVAFFWFPSDIHHILIKVWVSKVWVLSKFDQTLTFESLSFVKVWWNSDFKSLSFVKVWLLKVWVLSKFDETLTFENSDFQKSKFDQTLTKLRLLKLKVWSKFDKTQTFETQTLIKFWWKSIFLLDLFHFFPKNCFIFFQSDFKDIKSHTKKVSDMLSIGSYMVIKIYWRARLITMDNSKCKGLWLDQIS